MTKTHTARKRNARDQLASAANMLSILKRPLLESLKAQNSELKRGDFLWHFLLQSFATLGGVSGWDGLMGDQNNYREMSYNRLQNLSPKKRVGHAAAVFEVAKVRYPNQKAKNIIACFDRIESLGGLRKAKKTLLNQSGRTGKIKFLKSFAGIGDKYARNIMMDVYHEDFRDSIAIDSRIQAISDQWELEFDSYQEHEDFYLEVAKLANLNGWELDRLMFRFQNVFYPPIADV